MSEAQRNFTTEELKTEAGKELAVYKITGTSLYRVCFTSGGQIPKDLDGMWTDPVMAQKSIKAYLAGKDRKPVPSTPVFTDEKSEVKPVVAKAAKKKTSKKKTSVKKKD